MLREKYPSVFLSFPLGLPEEPEITYLAGLPATEDGLICSKDQSRDYLVDWRQTENQLATLKAGLCQATGSIAR